MNTSYDDKRLAKRIFFSGKDGIYGEFDCQGLFDKKFQALIINMSEGGLGLTIPKNESPDLRQGDRLLIKEIEGREGLDFFQNIEADIRWILQHEALQNVAFGCEFTEIPIHVKQELIKFIENSIEERKIF